MYLLLLRYYSKLFKKMKMLVSKSFTYYFLNVIIAYFFFFFLMGLVWYFDVKCERVKMRREIFKNIIFRY